MNHNSELVKYLCLEKEMHEKIHQQNFDILKMHFGVQYSDELLVKLSKSSNINYLSLESVDNVNYRQKELKKIENYVALLEKA